MTENRNSAESFIEFVDIVRRLRKECPWDREQTHESLRRCLLEEAYEVLESIDNNDKVELKKELGDLLLQVVFHAIMAEETNSFTLDGIIKNEINKLIARHPHVFGETVVTSSEQVKINWEKLKEKEGRKKVLDGIPSELPALFRAYRIQEKAAKTGFDWKDPAPVYQKILEEIQELKSNIELSENQSKIEDEFGDVLFAIVNYARFLKINPEDALRKTNAKFIYRFEKIEEHAKQNGIKLENMTLEEMDEVWNRAKEKNDKT